MGKDELVSIIMPAFNAGKYISQSIESVLKQTYQNWELIIINDGSTDDTKKVVDSFLQMDSRIQYIWQENGKQGKARNAGLKRSKGELIAFLDADDLWMPVKLEKQIDLLHQQNADLIFTDVLVVDEKGAVLTDTCSVENKTYFGSEGLSFFYRINQVPILTVLAKREAILKVGCFKEALEIQNIEDYDLWLRMLRNNAKFISINDKLGAYRRHDTQTIKGKYSMLKILKMLNEIETQEPKLLKAKNSAVRLWVVRCLKQDVNKTELKQIISFYPNHISRFIFKSLFRFLNKEVLRKVIYYSSKENLFSSGMIYLKSKAFKASQ